MIQVTGDPAGLAQLATVLQADLASFTPGTTDVVFSDTVTDIADQYDLFRNEDLLDLLVRTPGIPTTWMHTSRRETLRAVDGDEFDAWLPEALPTGQYISILTCRLTCPPTGTQ